MSKLLWVVISLASSGAMANEAVVDPTLPLGVAAQEPKINKSVSRLNLQGIYRRGENFTAVINNQIVSRGDFVGGAKVMSIRHNKVVLQKNQKNIYLSLSKPILKPVSKGN